MDIITFLQDCKVPFVTEGKNVSEGWVSIKCLFCDDPSYHLGINIGGSYAYCWRCGWHPLELIITKLAGTSKVESIEILKQLRIRTEGHAPRKTVNKIQNNYRLPTGVSVMTARHRNYLEKRRFDPDYLEKQWKLIGTGPGSTLDRIDFKHRIIIPVIWNNKEVSFTSRDITGKSQLRYITCPKEREIIPVKSILYGKQNLWKKTGICVEGPADVWRFGPQSFATLGIEFTAKQVREITRAFRRVFVCYDNDAAAISQANKLIAELRFREVEAYQINIASDPADMDQTVADYLVKQLLK